MRLEPEILEVFQLTAELSTSLAGANQDRYYLQSRM